MRLLDSADPSAGSSVPPSIRLDDLLAATGARLIGPTSVTTFATAAVDSRNVVPGCCFVALHGERTDGHRFAADAVRAGATVLIVERPVDLPAGADVAVLQVADPLRALQEVAAWWRARSSVRVVGITGSTGKTIAKEIVADVLSRTLRVLRNEGNLNSETGLPMTLLNLEPWHQVSVLEMSMYTEGEIARLAEIAQPEVGMVLAVHPTHLERAGSLEAIARAKAELPAALPADGLAVLNADDPRVAAMRDVTRATVRTFGLGPAADVRVWTNVGDAHLGHFASVEAIADAKAEILERASGKTLAVLNADDPRVMARAAGFPGRVATFGTSPAASVRAMDVRDHGVSGTEARVVTPQGQADVRVPVPGRGPLFNVLAATAVALAYDVPLASIVERAAGLAAAPRRGEVIRLGRGVVLIDDSYNSSPAALARALEALASEPAPRRVAVLGEMRELGEFSTALHDQSGRRAAAAGVALLAAVGGAPARRLADAAVDAGIPAGQVHYFASSEDAAPAVSAMLRAGDVVLVKGSRSTRTDVVADRVRAEWA